MKEGQKKKSCHRSGLSNSLTKTKVIKLIGLPGLVFSHLCFGTVFVFVVVVFFLFFFVFFLGGGLHKRDKHKCRKLCLMKTELAQEVSNS